MPSRASKAKRLPTANKPEPSKTVPFTENEIGGELVSLLSEGLYTNPLDALREYIQNAIDAGAKRVTVACTGRSLIIRDNGRGMTMEQLIKARRLAVSDKTIADNIGFRGIGIYSAFHVCDRMRIRTKVSGTFEEHIAEFDFKSMRTILSSERGSDKAQRTPLTALLTDHVQFWSKDHGLEDSATTVELINILPLYYTTLSDRDLTERYILDTVPVGFAPDSRVGDQINADIRASWPEYRPISVILSYPGQSDLAVIKKLPPDLVGPKTINVKSPTGQKIAMIWGCRTSHREMIGRTWPQLADIQGFVYKIKGVSVGARGSSLGAFSQGALYSWWTGEIWVLNDLVIPNAGRDGFEYNAASRELKIAVDNALREFEREASVFQQSSRARENLDVAKQEYERLRELSLKGPLTPRELGDVANALAKVTDASSKLKRFEEKDATIAAVMAECRLLSDKLKQLFKGAESGEPAKRSRRKKGTTTEPEPATETPTRPAPKTLGELIETMDLTDLKVAVEVLSALVGAIEDVIPSATDAYRDIASAFEAKLDELDLI
jgi:hypothetical protein